MVVNTYYERKRLNCQMKIFKSDGQEILISWQELKNQFLSFF